VTVVDENGRIFGKVNLIDLLVVSTLVGLIPLIYGAFLLFRTPDPQLQSVTPSQLILEETGSIRVIGANLRPNLRVRIGTVNTETFLVESQTAAEILLPEVLSPGTYDVVLFDEGLELDRLVNALTIEATPAMTINYDIQPAYWLTGEPGSLHMTGERLQPALLAKFEPNNNGDSINALAFLFESSTEAEIKVPFLPSVDGGYDLVLYDAEGQVEQARTAEPFIVISTPTIASPDCSQGTPCAGGERAVQGESEYIDIAGENLEPYMRAHFEPYLSVPNSVVYESPEPIIMYNAKTSALTTSKAHIRLPELDPGTYTLVLVRPVEARASEAVEARAFEYAGSGPAEGPRELVRIQGLLTVLSQPEPDPVTKTVRITVRFVSRSDVQFGMSVGDQDTSVFASGDSTDYLPSFPVDDFDAERIQEFLGQAPEEMHQRALQVLEDFGVLSGLVAGRGASAQQAAQASWATALAGDKKEQMRIMQILNLEDQRALELPVAEVQSVGPRRTMPGAATVGLPLNSAGGPSYITDQIVEVFDAVIDVPVTLTRLGWAYGRQHVKVGAVFQMETLDYAAQGWVLNMEFLSQADQRP